MTPKARQEPEKNDLLQAYDRILEVWKVQNDVYFKRVQIFMPVLQGGLLAVVLKTVFDPGPRLR